MYFVFLCFLHSLKCFINGTADCASETVVSADKVTIANACAAMWAIEGKFFDELPDHVERALEPWREDCHDITDVDASQMNEVHSCLATLADALAVSGLTELHVRPRRFFSFPLSHRMS